jgi:hypothetical protein
MAASSVVASEASFAFGSVAIDPLCADRRRPHGRAASAARLSSFGLDLALGRLPRATLAVA